MSEANTQRQDFHWPSMVQVVLTGIAILVSLGFTVLLVVISAFQLFRGWKDAYEVSTTLSLLVAGVLLTGLLAAAMYFGVMRLSSQTVVLGARWRRVRKLLHPKKLLIGYALALAAGTYAVRAEFSTLFLLPFFNIYALTVPVVVIVWLALRGLPKGSYQLGWGAFSLGLAIGPTVVLFLELAALIVLVVGSAMVITADPALSEIFDMVSRLGMESNDPYQAGLLLSELFNTPQFLFILLLFLACLVPLIEEFFKPISAWVLLGRKLRPVDGWVIGALSGAGFAVFENIGNATVSADWLIGVLQRTMASLPHVFTAALMGYTLALARSQRKYGKVLAVYIGVVLIHGAWNAGSVLTAAAGYTSPSGLIDEHWIPIILAVMGALVLGMLTALLRINAKLRKDAREAAAAIEPTAVELPETGQV